MNKKIAILAAVVALASLGANGQTRGSASVGATSSGQVNTALANGQVNTALPSGQVGATAQGNANGQAGIIPGPVPPPMPGDRRPPEDRVPVNQSIGANGQVNGADANGQVNATAVNPQTGVAVQGNAGSPPFATPPAPPGERPPGRPLSPELDGTSPRPFATGTNQAVSANTNAFAAQTNQFGAAGTNGFAAGTNQFGVNTNQSPGNQFGVSSNQSGLTPTSREGVNNGTLPQARDQASTPFDRSMLTLVRQRLQGPSAFRGAAAHVSFISNGGQITAVGSVATPSDKLQILSIIQSTPGVTGVTDQMTVTGTGLGAGPATQPAPANTGGTAPQ